MHVQISGLKNEKVPEFALFNLGFRVFFLGAALFSIASISLWSAIYLFQFSIPLSIITASQWHSHEMLYGYSLAVIAGFLLTAVKNWTGVQTVYGRWLVLLFALWLLARVMLLFGDVMLFLAAIFDLLFIIALMVVLAYPIFKVKQWKQISILVILALLAAANGLFYLGVYGAVANGVTLGIYAGLYLVLGAIFLMGRRVVPFFIEKGVDYNVAVYNAIWLDVSISLLFIAFAVSELFLSNPDWSTSLAIILFVLSVIRLIGWHTKGIWQKCLLWSLYLAFCFIALGFLLTASHYLWGTPASLAIHAFTFGGIGVVTMGMMSRVALGHTGRDIRNPPSAVSYALAILVAGAIVRVVVPLFEMENYAVWIALSQLLWLVAFLIFVLIYWPILIKRRVDGQFG